MGAVRTTMNLGESRASTFFVAADASGIARLRRRALEPKDRVQMLKCGLGIHMASGKPTLQDLRPDIRIR